MLRFVLVIIFGMLINFASGCAKYEKKFHDRFLWPPYGAAEPKIEFIDFYMVDRDVTSEGINWFVDQLLGVPPSIPLFTRPANVASGGDGRAFVTDIEQHSVSVIDVTKNEIRTLKNSKGSMMQFGYAFALTVTSDGRCYVVDSKAKKMYGFDLDEKLVVTYHDEDRLTQITGIAYDEELDHIYVVNSGQHKIYVYDNEGKYIREIGERGTGDSQFNYPLDVEIGPDGNLYVLDSLNFKVKVFSRDGTFLRSFGEQGTRLGNFQLPKAIAVSPSGYVYVTDSRKHCVLVFSAMGDYLLTLGTLKPVAGGVLYPGGFYLPSGIDADKNDEIWLADSMNRAVQRFQFLTPEYLLKHPLKDENVVKIPGFTNE